MENNDSNKSKLFERAKKTVLTVLRIRRGMKIFFAFGTGISMAIASFRILYGLIENIPLSLYYTVLAGAATTAFALLFMEIVRLISGKLTKVGLKLLDTVKDKKGEREKKTRQMTRAKEKGYEKQ